MQLSTASAKEVKKVHDLLMAEMSKADGRYQKFTAQVDKKAVIAGGIDAVVLTNYLTVAQKMNFTEIVGSGDIDLLRAVKNLPVGKYTILKNDPEKLARVDEGIAKLALGEQYDEYIQAGEQLNSINTVLVDLEGQRQNFEAQADSVASTSVEAA